MFHALYAIIVGNLKLKRYLKICLLNDDAGRDHCFSHEGRLYDREKFIELVTQDFRKMTVKERIQEVKALAEGLENSLHPELDRAYIEAFRRTLADILDYHPDKQ